MQEISPNVNTSAVMERLGVGRNEEIRQSNRRRRYLEKLSRVVTEERPNVELDPDHPTAHVNMEANRPNIVITTREFDQPATGLARDVYDMTIQEALLIHEVGHVLYTDNGAFQRTLSRVDLQYKGAYKRIWNALEDGAIEEQLRRRFNVEDEIYVANANIMGDKARDGEDEEAVQSEAVDLYGAVFLGCLDLAVYDSGKFARLRDESDDSVTFRSDEERDLLENLLPEMKDAVADVLTESDPVDRTERIYDFWTVVRDALDEADDKGQSQENARDTGNPDQGDGDDSPGLGDLFGDGDGDDGDSQQSGGISVMPIPKPDDSENADVGGGSSADRLEEQDEEEVKDEIDTTADPDEETTDDPGEEGGGASGGDGDEKDGDTGTSQEDREDEIEDERRGQLRQEAEEVDGARELLDEIEEYDGVMEDLNTSGNYQGSLNLRIPGNEKLDDLTRWKDAERRSRQVSQFLQQSLREERRSRRVKNERRGQFDRNRMVAASRGSARVFEREEEGDEKDYDCMIVVDRSGSMGGDRMELAENAVTALSLGLEDVGVGVSVLSMYSNNTVLENPFGVDIENSRGTMLSDRTGGATPLSQALAFGRERLENRGNTDNPFMIVVTDGKPDNENKYRAQLDKCTFPVLGVYVETNEDDSDLFHRQVKVQSGDIEEAITRLARQAMM